MSDATTTSELLHEGLARDDYALRRVPPSARYGWVTVAVQRFASRSMRGAVML
ncbi:hypothetical protein AB0B45_50565 [Nonomuraea sp. NPDC049152]|uniref:hypothetical protein n=1 Tax=Nonomuraea sp. NPDC049152 TaxID=3154350 RepID=UPI0033EAEBBE